MQKAMNVSDFRICELLVPSFCASVGDYVGIKTSAMTGDIWEELVLSLGGFLPRSEVMLSGKVGLCIPLMVDFHEPAVCKSAALAIQEHRFLLPGNSILSGLEGKGKPIGDGLAFRTLALVASAMHDECNIVLVSSDGLDPLGVKELNMTLRLNAKKALVVHFYDNEFASSIENIAAFSR
ncbi:hypothetical protein, partial [Rhodopirellula bahusiensis]